MNTGMNQLCAGIDIGGTSVKFGLFTPDGNLIQKWSIPTRTEANGCHILEDIACSLKETLHGLGLSLKNLTGAGMGIPGLVLPGGYVEICANLGWKSLNPQEILSGLLDGLPVRCENDANVAALGEVWQGGGRKYQDMVMITLGTGIGGGVILGGKIRSGKEGLCGELGHIHIIEEETESCGCGGIGCLEQAASATGIVRTANRLLNASNRPSLLRGKETVTAKDVIDAAKAGDAISTEALDRGCRYLGWVMSAVTMTIEPEAYVIGGGLSAAGTFLTDKIRHYHEAFTPLIREKIPVLLAELGNDAGIYGAARLILI